MSPTLRRRRKQPAAPPESGSDSADAPATAPVATELPGRDGFDDPPRQSRRPWRRRPDADGPAEETPDADTEPARPDERRALTDATPVLLLRAAHPRLGVLTAGGLAIAAALAGRPGREVGLVLATALVGQALLGWFNDLVDRRRDSRRAPSGKPIADGLLDPGNAWFAFVCGVFVLIPLAISNGVVAGCCYLGSVAIGLLGSVVLRKGWFSWVTWAASYALYPAFLSYGGWGGQAEGAPPQVAMVVVAALLGVGVHVLCALPGLVADHEDGFRHLPLRVALRIGAPRLLTVSLAWTVLALAGLLVVGSTVGLSR